MPLSFRFEFDVGTPNPGKEPLKGKIDLAAICKVPYTIGPRSSGTATFQFRQSILVDKSTIACELGTPEGSPFGSRSELGEGTTLSMWLGVALAKSQAKSFPYHVLGD